MFRTKASSASWAGDYLRRNPARFQGQRLSSRYVTMADGTRLAVDVHLPGAAGTAPQGFPAVVMFTPYYRRFALKRGHG